MFFSDLRRRIFAEDDYRCHYCKRNIEERKRDADALFATIDHKHPISKGGGWHRENLVTACNLCNFEKGNILYDHYIWFRKMRALGHDREDLLAAIAIVESEEQSFVPVAQAGRGIELKIRSSAGSNPARNTKRVT